MFQAEDGTRYATVTGVQTCALPISRRLAARPRAVNGRPAPGGRAGRGGAALRETASRARVAPRAGQEEIGRASCREREEVWGGGWSVDQNTREQAKVYDDGGRTDCL